MHYKCLLLLHYHNLRWEVIRSVVFVSWWLIRLFVRPSVRPSHGRMSKKRLKLGLGSFHHIHAVAHPSSF